MDWSFFFNGTPGASNVTPAVLPTQSTSAPRASQIGNTMKFISILESIGHKFALGVKKALDLEARALPAEKQIAGVITMFNPGVGATISGLLAVVGNVEQVAAAVGASTGSGVQKLTVALPGIEAAILADPLFAGKNIPDMTVWNANIVKFTSALVDLANSVESATAPVTSAGNSATSGAMTALVPKPVVVSLAPIA